MSHVNLNNLTYNFSDKSKRNLWTVFGVGILLLILGIVFNMSGGHAEAGAHEAHDHSASLGQRIWANILVNSYFFGGLALGSVFFYAVQYAAQASWSTVFMRLFSAAGTFLPIGMGLIILVLIVGRVGGHHLYHWQDPQAYVNDPIMQHKAVYFADWFFWLRIAVFVGGWCWYQAWSRKNALNEDTMRGETGTNWLLNLKNAAIFIVFFGFTSSVFSWDVMMSIDTHWYSTLFGWYNFSGWWLGAIIVANLLVMHLKSRNQLEYATASHVHDLGKWMFAISFLWTYLWFSQFMLIWYSNIPEEVVYYQQRWEQYRGLFWITMIVNFSFPMLVLMSRDSKRNKSYLLFTALIILFFHWTDTFVMVMPGTVAEHWGIGGIEIGMFIAFAAFFTFWILRAISQAPLLAKNHALLEEGLHHHA
ncbi:MAG TPA: quinol:cytochrome C oxidoreductase [Bacteroidia bacterium]|nr:quinol:cytochrome C oxidoreductase [Bacteroidia bacterium]